MRGMGFGQWMKKSLIIVIVFACFGKQKKRNHLCEEKKMLHNFLFYALSIVLKTSYTSYLIFTSTYEMGKLGLRDSRSLIHTLPEIGGQRI